MRIRQVLLGLGLGLIGVSNPAFAQVQANASEAEIDDAYQKAADGLKQYKAGRYAEALDAYTRAYSIVHLPALAVHIARANIKLGRFVAAMQFYDEALTLPDGVGDPQVQAKARVEAKTEGQALLARIPRLLFHTSGVSNAGVTLRVDGAIIPPDAYAAGWLVDPGSHQVLASFGTQEQRRWVSVSEGESRDLSFFFAPPPKNVNAPYKPPDTAPAPERSSIIRTAAWVSMGIGGAGVLVWGTAGLVALGKSNHLKSKSCGGGNLPCPQGELDSYNHWKTASTVGFYTGAAALLTGATLYFVAPREKKSRDTTSRVVPWLGISSAGLEGSF